MRLAMFTKLFGDSDLGVVAQEVAGLGLKGVDLLVRQGYAVVPSRPAGIGEAARIFARAGLQLEMVTTDLIEGDQCAAAVLAACADAGVSLVRLGFYRYDPSLGYARCRERGRRQLGELEAISRRTGIRLALQLHHGTLHSSGALAAALLEGRDGQAFGIYVDPGNQVKQGSEDWRLTLELAGDRLCCVGVKNAGWYAAGPSGAPPWEARWVPLEEGLVPWPEILSQLNETGYDGLLSLHAFYQELRLPAALEAVRRDLNFLRTRAAPASEGWS